MPKSPSAVEIKRRIDAQERRMGLAREMVKVEKEVGDVEAFLRFDRAAQRAFKGIISRPVRRAMMLRTFGAE
jgi:hypothetical protein